MPATDSTTTMQPISGPIPVPGTQREPTTPPVSDIGALLSNTSTSGSSTLTNAVSPRTSVIGKSQTALNHHHQRESANSTPPSAAHNQNHHNTHHDRHNNNNINNINSGLRRFPSIGNTTKLNVENSTLRAKIVELERYLTGLKEELILAHRQIHAQRAEIKNEKEHKSEEVDGLKERIEECEKELRVRKEECDGLRAQLQVARIQGDTITEKEKKKVEEVVSKKEETTKKKQTPSTAAVATEAAEASATTTAESNSSSSSANLDRIKALEEENARKDAQIKELLEKVDRLGTEVLNLERDKARLERPLTPEPVPAVTTAKTKIAVVAPEVPLPKSATLDSIIPITAEAIIAATTPQSTSVSAGTCVDRRLPESTSNNSLKSSSTSPSSVESDSDLLSASGLTASAGAVTVNSVGYNFAVEHPKLLAKFQALRMQHAQASEYVDSLESENRDLKVQLLDICAGSALVA
ncbi:hypothetical protein BG015_009436 [Linnemannia schmuckeri]|uniref:Uncharacterized protein n=1 Tax=Linnemannia schmuckeri TaxID=64567 RepID=A0A9P5VEW0_9FUNG|nr:hypothetical protein BG015_009436 [Linnemannia schmuckeri]